MSYLAGPEDIRRWRTYYHVKRDAEGEVLSTSGQDFELDDSDIAIVKGEKNHALYLVTPKWSIPALWAGLFGVGVLLGRRKKREK